MPDPFVVLTRKPATESGQLTLAGIVTRHVAHSYGVPHGAVQIAVIIQKKVGEKHQPHILLHQRSQYKKIDPKKWDICGGHLEADQHLLQYLKTENWNNPSLIKELFWETAQREVNEEVHFLRANFNFQKSHLHCFGQIGMFETGMNDPNAINREYGSFFLCFVPPTLILLNKTDDINHYLKMSDTISIDGKAEEAEIKNLKMVTLDKLIDAFLKQPNTFADGIARVLIRLNKAPKLLGQLNELLDRPFNNEP